MNTIEFMKKVKKAAMPKKGKVAVAPKKAAVKKAAPKKKGY